MAMGSSRIIDLAGSRITLLLAVLLAFATPIHAQYDRIKTQQAALAASALDLARAYSAAKALLELLPLAEGGGTIQIPGKKIGPNNVKDVKAELVARVAIYEAVIRQRGSAHLAGMYHGTATPTCAGIQSAWASGVQDGSLANVKISEDSGFTIQLEHRLVHNADTTNVKIPAVVVDSALTFSDPMNSDYVLIGQVSGGTIAVRPDVDAILAAWPNWVKAPNRGDLGKCVVTLTPSGR
jgi:hypothetical protein